MAIPVPQLQHFSVQPGLSAYITGKQMRQQEEDREMAALQRDAERMGAAAVAAQTPEQWDRWLEAAGEMFPGFDLEPYRDFETGRALAIGNAGPDVAFNAANLDINRQQLDLQRQAFAADQAARARAEAAPRGFEQAMVGNIIGQRNLATGQFEPYPEWMQPGGGQEIDFGDEQQLRTSFNQLTANYRALNDAYGRIQTSAAQATAPGDMSLIFSYMKMLDPTSTVREGEYASAQNTTGIAGTIINLYNQAVDGTLLNPQQRQEFVNTANQLLQVAQGAYDTTSNYYRGLATQYGMDPDRIVPPSGQSVVSAGGPSGLAANPNAPRSPQPPAAPSPLTTTPPPAPTPPSLSTGQVVRPPELTQENIIDTVRAARAQGKTFEQVTIELAQRYGVSVEQMQRWMQGTQ
jgi:hypothetical protein